MALPGYGIGTRILPDRHADKPLGGEIEAGYGIGNRMLPDRHADRPPGGEIEAGYGLGNRHVPEAQATLSLVRPLQIEAARCAKHFIALCIFASRKF